MYDYELVTPQDEFSCRGWREFLDAATEQAYETLLWQSTEWDDHSDSATLDPDVYFTVAVQVADFLSMARVRDAIQSLKLAPEDVGHNFILSANGHGTGFWDRGWDMQGDILHEASKNYQIDLYEGEDSVFYV